MRIKTKKIISVILAALMAVTMMPFTVFATEEETIFSVGAESGELPEGWSLQATTTAAAWFVGVGDGNESTGTHSGNYNFKCTCRATDGNISYLISPTLNLSSKDAAQLDFWYTNRIWGEAIDIFEVCYRVSGGEWISIFTTGENQHNSWTSQTVNLPDAALTTGVQIGFKMTLNYGSGVALDDVVLTATGSSQPDDSDTPVLLFEADAESGAIPEGWSIVSSNISRYNWEVGVGDIEEEIGTHSGDYNFKCVYEYRAKAYLTSPKVDLSNKKSATLSFWYVNRPNEHDASDVLGVYYRAAEGDWNQIFSSTYAYHDTWTEATVTLPAEALTSDVQIGFAREDWNGDYGLAVDDISFSAVNAAAPTGVAAVNGTGYPTLEEAIAAATAGDTVTLLQDIELSNTLSIAAGKNIKLDLDGNDIYGAVNGNLIENNGTVEFVNGTGHIYNTDITAQSHDAFRNFGTVTVNAPVHFGDADDDMTNANAINRGGALRNYGGTAVINNGYYTAIDNTKNGNNKMTIYAYALINDSDGTMTINNATVYGKNNGNVANNSGSVVINGGTFTLTKNTATNYYNIYGAADTSTEIAGGTFTTNTKNAVYLATDAALDISDGNFTYVNFKATSATDSNVNISGGKFSSLVPQKYCANGYIPVTEPNAQGKYTVNKAENGVSITVDSTIDTNFYLDNDYPSTGYVKTTYNTNSNSSETAEFTSETKQLSELGRVVGGDYAGDYKVSIPQAPAQITEDILVEVYATEAAAQAGTSPLYTVNYNAAEYCKAVIASTEASESLKNLAQATLDYGAAAKDYFHYSTASAASDYANRISGVTPSGVPAQTAGILTGAALVVIADPQIKLFTNGAVAVNGSENATATAEVSGDKNFIRVTGIAPANFGQTFTVNTSAGEISMSMNTILGMMAGNADMAMLAKGMYNYGTAAAAYFAG